MMPLAVRIIRRLTHYWKRAHNAYYRGLVRMTVAKVGKGLSVNGKTLLTPNTWLGEGVSFNGLVVNGGGKVTIGSHFHSGPDCLFITEFHNYDKGKAIPYDETQIIRDIMIEDNVWLGSRVIVLGGVTIGEGAIIQAGSCVVSNVPRCAIAGGHPAKVFKMRDIEHFDKLKAEGKFQ